jgi:hypothetical protein
MKNPGPVVPACNPSFLGDKASTSKKFLRLYLEENTLQKKDSVVTQVVKALAYQV